MAANALLGVYGPFNHGGQFTRDSHAPFDFSLRDADTNAYSRRII